MTRAAQLAATLIELGRVLMVLPVVEVGKRRRGPKLLLETLRRKGGRCQQRDPAARARLQRAIGWVDARVPGGPNCYRRALLEIVLDRGAATEPFHMGFNVNGGPLRGHAWLGMRGGSAEDYDTSVVL